MTANNRDKAMVLDQRRTPTLKSGTRARLSSKSRSGDIALVLESAPKQLNYGVARAKRPMVPRWLEIYKRRIASKSAESSSLEPGNFTLTEDGARMAEVRANNGVTPFSLIEMELMSKRHGRLTTTMEIRIARRPRVDRAVRSLPK